MNETRVVAGKLQGLARPDGDLLRREKVGGEPPVWLRIFPDGDYVCDDGTFICDAESRTLCLEFFTFKGNDVVIDYEHQTLTGEIAPAAGWIVELEDRGKQGLWARCEWTERGAQAIRDGEYRYYSPVFDVERVSNRVTKLHHVALTNWPGSHGMMALTEQLAESVRTRLNQKAREGDMGLSDSLKEQLRWMLNVGITVTNKEVRTGLLRFAQLAEAIPDDDKLFFSEGDTTSVAESLGLQVRAAGAGETQLVASKALLEELELPETATPAQAHARVIELRANGGQAETLKAENQQLREQIAAAQTTDTEAKILRLIQKYRSKIPPAKEPLVRTLVTKHGFDYAESLVKEFRDELPSGAPAADEPPAREIESHVETTEGVRVVGHREYVPSADSAEQVKKVEQYMQKNQIKDFAAAVDRMRGERLL